MVVLLLDVAVGIEIKSEGRGAPVEEGAAVAYSVTCIWHRVFKSEASLFLHWFGGCVTIAVVSYRQSKYSTVS